MSSSEVTQSMSVPAAPRRGGRVLPAFALVVALAALGLAAWAAFRPPPVPVVPSYTDAQQASAKATSCASVELVRKGVTLNTTMPSPGGDADVTGSLAVAANARLSLSTGGQYLLDRLDPATPTALANDVRSFAGVLMDIGAASVAGALNTDPDQAARLRDADTLYGNLAEACK